jgi:chemotaxis protein methyltransferase CheR
LYPLTEPSFECIFIRNVLIYFDRESKQVALSHLINSLQIGGYLVVGPSEGVYDLLGHLEKISPLIYRKGDSARRNDRATAGKGEQR